MKFYILRQIRENTQKIDDVKTAVKNELSNLDYDFDSLKNKKIGIAVGSRGIDQIRDIVKNIVDFVRDKGGVPVVFAAMGSHGGGTSEGQAEVLAGLGITEKTVGAEILTCGESDFYGKTESGLNVYGNKLPLSFDGTILVNRIKMHTDFSDVTESGLYKLMAIGIGNPKGCQTVHRYALRYGFGNVIRQTGEVMLKKLPVLFGVAVTENWKHQLNHIEAVIPQNLFETEKRLLADVKEHKAALPVKEADTLLIENGGKNISGTCIDTKVIGRIYILGQEEPKEPKISRIAVFNLTEESHGNAIGIGLADVIPKKVYDKINVRDTSLNSVSSMCLEQGRIPCVVENDFEAFKTAIGTIGIDNDDDAKVLFIKDTNSLEYVAVSESLYNDLKERNDLETIGEAFELKFDDKGNLLSKWQGNTIIETK